MSAQPFSNRAEAGKLLAARFSALAWREDVIVLALPRGGVPVGFEVANALGVALDVFVGRKLGVPGHEELAMGAIASGDVRGGTQPLAPLLRKDADDVVCLRMPDPFVAVGVCYRDFSETPDAEVRALLGRSES